MTSEYDELLVLLDGWVASHIQGSLANQATAAIRALTAQVVERDAVIEQAEQWSHDVVYGETPRRTWADLAAIFAQAPRDALAARDAVRDKTVRATALRDAAEWAEGSAGGYVPSNPEDPNDTGQSIAEWLRARADQEEL